MITVEPQGSYDYQSEDYQEISSKLDDQICEQAQITEEKVCCEQENAKKIRSGTIVGVNAARRSYPWMARLGPGLFIIDTIFVTFQFFHCDGLSGIFSL